MYGYPMMNGNDWGWGMAMMLFWTVLLIVVVVVVVRLLKSHEGSNTQKMDPLDIAKERYAKGEITKDEFEQLRKDLK
jgi:putative membrane protein